MISNLVLTGVWVGDVIHDLADGVLGDDVLEIEIEMQLLEPYEVKDLSGESGTREWCVPAIVLNTSARLRILTQDEEDELATRDLPPIAPDDPRLKIGHFRRLAKVTPAPDHDDRGGDES